MRQRSDEQPRGALLTMHSGQPSHFPRGLAREERRGLAGDARERLLAATVELAAELGYSGITDARLALRAGVPREALEELFDDREACLLAAFEEAMLELRKLVLPAYVAHARWVDALRDSLAILLAAFDRDPAVATLCLIESAAAGRAALGRRAEILAALATVVDRGREESSRGELAAITAEGVVAAVVGVLQARLVAGGAGTLSELSKQLMSIVVLPYLGPRAARRELARRAAPASQRSLPSPPQPSQMRVTYRTLRVLAAIADAPGSGNRAIAAAAGIVDEGQASRLLARLHRLALIGEYDSFRSSGRSHAWRLTASGEALLCARHGWQSITA